MAKSLIQTVEKGARFSSQADDMASAFKNAANPEEFLNGLNEAKTELLIRGLNNADSEEAVKVLNQVDFAVAEKAW